MSMPVFPALESGDMDSSKFAIELDDNTISEEIEGGYTVTRARSTRALRKTFLGGFTFITDADKALLEEFWQLTHGKSVIFLWNCIQDGVAYQVRFKEKLKFSYVGVGNYQRWNCEFTFQQA